MTDYFSFFDEQRRPWLDADSLKAKFLALSAEVHPDRSHNAPDSERQAASQRFLALNAAYNCLREHKCRLLHLLELESGTKPKDVQTIPSAMMDLAIEVGQLCRRVDDFLAERGGVTSPLLKVRMFERGEEWADRVRELLLRIKAAQSELDEVLKGMNAAWEHAPAIDTPARICALPLDRLEQVYRLASYFARWTEQARERVTQLAF